jgi:hypothetical protein
MAEQRKYERLVKPLNVGAMDRQKANDNISREVVSLGPGNADKLVWLNGRDHLEGLNLNFTWGFHSGLGDWYTGLDSHISPYPEALVFVGLDPANINYLGAEIEIALGEELEVHTFDKPSVVVIPAGMPHYPLVTKRVWSPIGFGFFRISLGAVPETARLGESISKVSAGEKPNKKSKTAKSTAEKYAHLVKPLYPGLLIENGKLNLEKVDPEERLAYETGKVVGPGNADHLVWMYGKDLEGLDTNFLWGFYSKPGIWRRGISNHSHTHDEAMVFVGTDPSNIDYLGAEIEIDMGKEHERYVFDKPTIVVCPGGVPHMPVITRYVDRPYAFFVIGLGGERRKSDTTWIEDD